MGGGSGGWAETAAAARLRIGGRRGAGRLRRVHGVGVELEARGMVNNFYRIHTAGYAKPTSLLQVIN